MSHSGFTSARVFLNVSVLILDLVVHRQPIMQRQLDVYVKGHLDNDVGKLFLLFVHLLHTLRSHKLHVTETTRTQVSKLGAVDFLHMER